MLKSYSFDGSSSNTILHLWKKVLEGRAINIPDGEKSCCDQRANDHSGNPKHTDASQGTQKDHQVWHFCVFTYHQWPQDVSILPTIMAQKRINPIPAPICPLAIKTIPAGSHIRPGPMAGIIESTTVTAPRIPYKECQQPPWPVRLHCPVCPG